jgi:hypothetical protein
MPLRGATMIYQRARSICVCGAEGVELPICETSVYESLGNCWSCILSNTIIESFIGEVISYDPKMLCTISLSRWSEILETKILKLTEKQLKRYMIYKTQ